MQVAQRDAHISRLEAKLRDVEQQSAAEVKAMQAEVARTHRSTDVQSTALARGRRAEVPPPATHAGHTSSGERSDAHRCGVRAGGASGDGPQAAA